MADVNLEVGVQSAGFPSALRNLSDLLESGKKTGLGLNTLAAQSRAAGKIIADSFSAVSSSGGKLTNVQGAMRTLGSESDFVSGRIQAMEQRYRDLAVVSGATTAEQRLGAGQVTAAVLKEYEALLALRNANPLADQAEIDKRNAAAKEAVAQAARDAAAAQEKLNLAQSTRTSATAALARTQEDYANQIRGISAVEQAEINLVRANEELAASQELLRAVPNFAPALQRTEAQTSAIITQERALQGVITATEQLNRAQSQAKSAAATTAGSGTQNAYLSSFSYFIVGRAAQQAAKDIFGVEVAAVSASSQIQRSFADVERTFAGTHAQLIGLEQQLFQLSTIDPVSITDLAQIAALGNQLGIAQQNVADFTQTIAEYSTISGQSAEDSATAFGKIAALTGLAASQYSNLGSAIEYVARTSVSTEAGIQNTAEEITAIAAGAGFSADAIVGLSGALASLSIPPERARGALSLYFGALNNAVAQGGPKLQEFATLTGYTTEQIGKLVEANKGQDVFTAFLKGLSNLNSVAKTTALDDLGLSTIRVDQTMRALSQNVPLVTKSLEGSANAFSQNTELAKQYNIIQKTLTSTWKEFQNSIQNALAGTGDIFNVKSVLEFVKGLQSVVTEFRAFAETPTGKVILGVAAAMGAVLAVALALVGTLAFVTAGMKLIPWALTGLGAADAEKPVLQFMAGLIGINLAAKDTEGELTATATRFSTLKIQAQQAAIALEEWNLEMEGVTLNAEQAAVGLGLLDAATRAETEATVAGTAGFTAMKFALAATGIGLAVVLIGTLVQAFGDMSTATQTANDRAKEFFGGSMPTLAASLVKDQTTYEQTGSAIEQIGVHITDSKQKADKWVTTLETSTGAQVQLGKGTAETTKTISEQTIAYGKNTQEALANALANNKNFQALFKSNDSLKALSKTAGFNQTDFAQAILGDPVNGGKEYVDALVRNLSSELGASQSKIKLTLKELQAGFSPEQIGEGAQGIGGTIADQKLAQSLQALEPAYFQVKDAADSTSTALKQQSQLAAASKAANDALALAAGGAGSGFAGAAVDITALQDAIQSGLKGFVDFSTVLTAVQGKLKSPLDVNATAFNKGLETANSNAVTFFNGITQLAKNGDTSFAQQLATLGPDAGGVLASSLKLTPEAQNQLEENARFAAFLASDAFKKAIAIDSKTSNSAYAQILSGGGSLSDVQNYITAQVTGVASTFETAWDAAHPNFRLNVDLPNLSPQSIALFKEQQSGRITVEAEVVPTYDPSKPYANASKFKDTKTGAAITLPANLDGNTLSASLDYWIKHPGSTASQIEAHLNSKNFDTDITAWEKKHGPITVGVTIAPSAQTTGKGVKNTAPSATLKVQGDLDTAQLSQQLGRWKDQITPTHVPANINTSSFLGDIEKWISAHPIKIKATLTPTGGSGNIFTGAQGGSIPHFAKGGGYGQFNGPGTGTSDSLWARVSAGEFLSTNEATRFWGPDFFDSLNKKMLPTSFLNMLGAAAVSGNQGPSHVAYVTQAIHNPLTRDPIKQLSEDSQNLAAGLWS